MEIILYNLNEEEMQRIDDLERDNPEIVVKTVLASFDSGVYTELIIPIVSSLIEAAGAIIAAIIVARATRDSKKDEKDKTVIEEDNDKEEKNKKIIIIGNDGKEHEVYSVDDLNRVLKEINNS